jgi:hypothetical protein
MTSTQRTPVPLLLYLLSMASRPGISGEGVFLVLLLEMVNVELGKTPRNSFVE